MSTSSETIPTAAPALALTVSPGLHVASSLGEPGGAWGFGRLPWDIKLTVSTVNPFSKEHGAPTDENRHVGDLGNFKTDAQGNSKGSVTDSQVKLIGKDSVLGVCCRSHSGCGFLSPA